MTGFLNKNKISEKNNRKPAQLSTATSSTNSSNNICLQLTPSSCIYDPNKTCKDYTIQAVNEINNQNPKRAQAWAMSIFMAPGDCEMTYLSSQFNNPSCLDRYCKPDYATLVKNGEESDPCFDSIKGPLIQSGHAMVVVREITLSEQYWPPVGVAPTIINGVALDKDKYIYAVREPQTWGQNFNQEKCVWVQSAGRPNIPQHCQDELIRYMAYFGVDTNMAPRLKTLISSDQNPANLLSTAKYAEMWKVVYNACKAAGKPGFK